MLPFEPFPYPKFDPAAALAESDEDESGEDESGEEEAEVDWESMSADELRKGCRLIGVSEEGSKEELIARLQEAMPEDSEEEDGEEGEDDDEEAEVEVEGEEEQRAALERRR